MAAPMPASSSSTPTLASLQQRARELLDLARDPSEPARAALVAGLYDLSLASAELPADDRALALDILLKLIQGVATSVRHQLAIRMARDPAAPKPLVVALARDEIAVAFPVLIESPVLDEADLIEILRDCPPEHRLGALQRESIGENISIAATQIHDPQVMRWLIENPGARIPRDAMEIIVATSQVEPGLQKPIVERADLPADLAERVHAFVPEALRRELGARHQIRFAGEAAPTAPAKVAVRETKEADQLALAAARERRAAGALTVDLLLKSVRSGRMAEFEAMFACFSHLSLEAARQILASPTGEALAVALKAQGVPKGTFATVFILTRKARDPAADLSSALARATDAYDRLGANDAKKRFAALRSAHPEDSGS